MAGLIWYRAMLEQCADPDGYYPNMHVGEADGVYRLTKNNPYALQPIPAGGWDYENIEKLVGGTVAWNQLFKAAGASTINGIAFSRSEDLSVQTMNGTATANAYRTLPDIPSTIVNHIYYVSQEYAITGVQIYNDSAGVSTQGNKETIGRATAVKGWFIRVSSGTALDNVSIRPLIIDLTQMLGSAIADYVYSLEQATAGSGIQWLKDYDLIDDNYHAYSQGSLESVNVSAHVMRDADNNIIETYPIDSSVTLRGMLKKDASDNLYYDGDEYLPDGTVNRYYGERTYQAGDESLTDAITDGTNTVYKLTTPTTESADPYTALQVCDPDGTEEWVDYGVAQGTRDCAMPAGSVRTYERSV